LMVSRWLRANASFAARECFRLSSMSWSMESSGNEQKQQG
jgi:hypothetical protein